MLIDGRNAVAEPGTLSCRGFAAAAYEKHAELVEEQVTAVRCEPDVHLVLGKLNEGWS